MFWGTASWTRSTSTFCFRFAIIALAACTAAVAQPSFDGNFDFGNLASVSTRGRIHTLGPDTWLHFRVRDVAGTTPHFRVHLGLDSIYDSDHRMVFRYEGQNQWYTFKEGWIKGQFYHFTHDSPFTHNVVYIAYWQPWSFEQMLQYLEKISSQRYVRNMKPRGFSKLGRPIYGLEVTDSTIPDDRKRHIVVTARQHYNEPPASFVNQGMMDYLVYSDDREADKLRKQAIVHFYPMCVPDSVALGNEKDLPRNPNREWWPGAPPDGQPSRIQAINILRQAILNDTGGHADYAIDLHAHPGHKGLWYWWGITSGSEQENSAAAKFAGLVRQYDANDHNNQSVLQETISLDVLTWPFDPAADYWCHKTLGAISFTLEPGSVPAHTTDRMREVGVALCKALCDMVDHDQDSIVRQHNTAARASATAK